MMRPALIAALALLAPLAQANTLPPPAGSRVFTEAARAQTGEELVGCDDAMQSFYEAVENRIAEHLQTMQQRQEAMDLHLTAWMNEAMDMVNRAQSLIEAYSADSNRWAQRMGEYYPASCSYLELHFNESIPSSVALVYRDIRTVDEAISALAQKSIELSHSISANAERL